MKAGNYGVATTDVQVDDDGKAWLVIGTNEGGLFGIPMQEANVAEEAAVAPPPPPPPPPPPAPVAPRLTFGSPTAPASAPATGASGGA